MEACNDVGVSLSALGKGSVPILPTTEWYLISHTFARGHILLSKNHCPTLVFGYFDLPSYLKTTALLQTSEDNKLKEPET